MKNNKFYAVYYNGIAGHVYCSTIENIREHSNKINDEPFHIYKDKQSAIYMNRCLCHQEELKDVWDKMTRPIEVA